MKYLLIVLFPFLLPDKDLECKDFHNGTFELPSYDGSVHLITRKDGVQTEFVKKTGVKSIYTLNWLNDCSYILFNRKVVEGVDEFPGLNKDTVICEIIKIKGSECVVTAMLRGYDQKLESTMKKIK